MTPKRALISYCHKDESYRSSLISALSGAIRSGELLVWSDHEILPGADIDDEIMAQLRVADVVLLLISPDFIASEYCYKRELQVALERHSNGHAKVVPIVVRPTDWAGAPFSNLLMLPYDAKAVSSWSNVDEAWLDVAQNVRRLVRELPPSPERPHLSKPQNITSRLADLFDELQRRYVNPDSPPGALFGIPTLDEAANGLLPREVAVIASRPDHGHLELAMSAVLTVAWNADRKTLVISQRLAAPQYTSRILCALGRVSRSRLARGYLEDEDWSRVTSSIRLLREADITIDDDPIRSFADLRERLMLAKEHGYGLVVIDGIEYMSAGNEERSICMAIADFAKESDAAVVVTVTLDPSLEQRAFKQPILADLGSWRVIEGFATKLLLCERSANISIAEGGIREALGENCKVRIVQSPDGLNDTVELRYWSDYGMVDENLVVAPTSSPV